MRYYHTRELKRLRNELEGIITLQLLHAIKHDLARRMTHNNMKIEYDRFLGDLQRTNLPPQAKHALKRRSEVLEKYVPTKKYKSIIYICFLNTELIVKDYSTIKNI